MTFRPRQGNYITQRRGRYYYRRMIPVGAQKLFGKKVWMIPLEGRNDADRRTEAQALAHKHNTQLSFCEPMRTADLLEDSKGATEMRVDLDPENAPPGVEEPSPLFFFRDGEVHQVYRYAISDVPAQRQKAETDGFFAMSQEEAKAQFEVMAQLQAMETADTPERQEIAELKGERAINRIEATSRVSGGGETVLSILPRWRARQGQAATTWKKHEQYAREFAELHEGDIYLSQVTRNMVVAYVEHAQTLTYRGAPLSPTSIAKRLDSIRALLSFAVSVGDIESNPASGVKPPKDNRPKSSRSWKSFEPDEIKKLVKVSTDIWSGRRNSKRDNRKEDLMTALQCLIWTGARLEEVCQLRRDDISLATCAMHITNDETEDDARARFTKNENSIRTVPIHSRLTPVLTEHLRRHNSPLLFPSFEPEATASELEEEKVTGKLEIKGRYARPLSREWTDNLRQLIAKNEPRKVLYSLRHSWAAESRRSGMPEHVRNAIMGHADDNPHAARYGGDAEWLEEKRLHIERMNCV